MINFCTLYSSSKGNSIYVSDGSTHLLIDAGVSASKIINSLSEIGISPEDIDGILVTHEHTDHIQALGVLTRRYGIPIYANHATLRAISNSPYAPNEVCIRPIVTGMEFKIGGAVIRPFATPHDSMESVGYSITTDKRKLAVATDTGCVTKGMLTALAGSEAVVIEANHDIDMLKGGMYPYPLKKRILSDRGHLCNENCAWLATQLALWGTKHIVLGHLSENNNTPEKAYKAVHTMLSDNGFVVGKDVFLTVAGANQITKIL